MAIFSSPFPTGIGAHSASSAKIKGPYLEAKAAGIDHKLPSIAEVNESV